MWTMNKEKFIATLQACYFGDKGAFNLILKEYQKLQQENEKLKETLNLMGLNPNVIFFYHLHHYLLIYLLSSLLFQPTN